MQTTTQLFVDQSAAVIAKDLGPARSDRQAGPQGGR